MYGELATKAAVNSCCVRVSQLEYILRYHHLYSRLSVVLYIRGWDVPGVIGTCLLRLFNMNWIEVVRNPLRVRL